MQQVLRIADNKPRGTPAPEFVSQTGRTLLNLREILLRGDFQPGERISELPLVARLGVSRTPIRLALDVPEVGASKRLAEHRGGDRCVARMHGSIGDEVQALAIRRQGRLGVVPLPGE